MLCRRGTRGSLCKASLWTAYYQGTQCSRTRTEPVCRINWIRWHDTFPSCRLRRKLHGRSATWQATPLATPGAVPTRQRLDTLNGGFLEQARKSGREIPFACIAIMYGQYVILYYIVWGPPVGDPTAMYAPPLGYKREALAAHTKLFQSSLRLKQYSTQWT